MFQQDTISPAPFPPGSAAERRRWIIQRSPLIKSCFHSHPAKYSLANVGRGAPVGTRMWLPPRRAEPCVRSRSFSQLCHQGHKLPSSGTFFLKSPGICFSGAAGIGLEGHSGHGGGGKGADFPDVTEEGRASILTPSSLSLCSLIPANPRAVNALGIKAGVTAQVLDPRRGQQEPGAAGIVALRSPSQLLPSHVRGLIFHEVCPFVVTQPSGEGFSLWPLPHLPGIRRCIKAGIGEDQARRGLDCRQLTSVGNGAKNREGM